MSKRNKLSVKTLLQEFPIPEKKDWEKVAQAETTGKSIADQKIFQRTKSLKIFPFYDHRDGDQDAWLTGFRLPASGVDLSHGARSWLNQPAVRVLDEGVANTMALGHLQQGVDGVLFVCAKTLDPDLLLRDIQLNACEISFEFVGEPESSIDAIKAYLIRNYPDQPVSIRVITPSATAPTGHFPDDRNRLLMHWAVKSTAQDDPAQEVADALTAGVKQLENLMKTGWSLSAAFRRLFFYIEGSEEFFITYAKCKALRLLWFQIVRAYGDSEMLYNRIFLHVSCPSWHAETYQPHATLISHTVGAVAAVCGGCNALTLLPENDANATLQRVARNVSNVLREEARLHTVADPLAGAYYPDRLVSQLAQEAWSNFVNAQS